MTKNDARNEFIRVTHRHTKVFDKPISEKEVDMAKHAARMTRRQRASHIIGGKAKDGREYVLLKFRNNMI